MNELAIVPRETALAIKGNSFEDIQRIGNLLAASGYFSDVRDMAQAAVKVMAGQELGIPPIAAMMGINIIKGKVALGAHLIASRIRAHGYDFRIVTMDNKGCKIRFIDKRGGDLGISEFGEEDAKNAGVFTDMYKKYPRNMYYSRCISNGAKWFTPDVFGGAPVYTPEELGAEVDSEGEMVQPRGTQEAANAVRDAKLQAAGAELPPPSEPKASRTRKAQEAPKVSFELLAAFTDCKKELGEAVYRAVLERHGFKSSKDIPSKEAAIPVYKELGALINDKRLGITGEEAAPANTAKTITQDQQDTAQAVWTEAHGDERLSDWLVDHGVPSGMLASVKAADFGRLLGEMKKGDAV